MMINSSWAIDKDSMYNNITGRVALKSPFPVSFFSSLHDFVLGFSLYYIKTFLGLQKWTFCYKIYF